MKHTRNLRLVGTVAVIVIAIAAAGVLLMISNLQATSAQSNWDYYAVDNNRPESQFGKMGLIFADANHDDWPDIIAGSYLYLNPEGDLKQSWTRIELPELIDVFFAEAIDDDEFTDLVGISGARVLWIEADDATAQSWTVHEIGTVPDARTQGHAVAQIVAGGKDELVFTRATNLFYLEIPENPEDGNWPITQISDATEEEGVAVGDMDVDGDLDVVTQDIDGHHTIWFENPGDGSSDWAKHIIGESSAPTAWSDRVALVDVNGDSLMDIITTEETQDWDYNAHIYWFESPEDPVNDTWARHTIDTLRSVNSLDVADMDGDGDMDIITGEHTDQTGRDAASDTLTAWYENRGNGAAWIRHLIGSSSHSNHLGTQTQDLDKDGDLDVVSIGWQQFNAVDLWVNPGIADIDKSVAPYFTQVIIDMDNYGDCKDFADIDGDGFFDGILTINAENGNINQRLVWYRYPDWKQTLIGRTDGEFTTDVAVGDMDNDGDPDIIIPIDENGQLYWYENPRPDGDPASGEWTAHVIGVNDDFGKDLSLADYDKNGYLDVVVRTNESIFIWFHEDNDTWTQLPIVRGLEGEGMEIGDIDSDGDMDIIAHGNWYETPDDARNGEWAAHKFFERPGNELKFNVIDFNGDGHTDVFVSCTEHPGCNLVWYEGPEDPINDPWTEHILGQVDYAHTIHVKDMDLDGDLDVVTAELKQSDDPDEVMIFVNSGDNLTWTREVVSTLGLHNGVVADIDNDGDYDILGANFGDPPYYLLRNTLIDNTNHQ